MIRNFTQEEEDELIEELEQNIDVETISPSKRFT